MVCRETGNELMAQVHYDEGVANHIGPESCAGIRKDAGEASVGKHAGQPLSRERMFSRVSTLSTLALQLHFYRESKFHRRP